MSSLQWRPEGSLPWSSSMTDFIQTVLEWVSTESNEGKKMNVG